MFFLRSPRREIAAAVHGAAARTDRMPVGRGLEDGLHCLEGALVKERKGEEDLVARTGGIFSWSGSTSWAGSRAARRLTCSSSSSTTQNDHHPRQRHEAARALEAKFPYRHSDPNHHDPSVSVHRRPPGAPAVRNAHEHHHLRARARLSLSCCRPQRQLTPTRLLAACLPLRSPSLLLLHDSTTTITTTTRNVGRHPPWRLRSSSSTSRARGDIPMSAVEKFPVLLSEAEEESSAVPPCFSHEGINYLYIRHNNLYLLALTKRNTNAAEILLFLHKIVQVFTEYFKALEEESIRDNFVIIYELLDEMMDFGYPQTTESKILQEYITQESHKLEIQARPPIAVTNAVSWRSEGIRYRKNEVFLDVVESLNLLVSANGNVLRSEILGAIKMKCYLSGMPELRLGLNDKVMFETTGRTTRGKAIEMEDVKFHQCVRLSRFENDRTISFIPPDGEFELMSYRLNTQVKPLIWVECVVESHSGSRIEYTLKARAQFKRRSTANNVEIIVPVPDDADTPRFRTNIGSVHYAPEQSAIVWKIKQFGGQKEFLMRAELGLPSVRGDDEHGGGMTGGFGGSMGGVGGMGKGAKRPIQVKFEIPYFTTSGIQVRYLKITEPKLQYPSLPWVRYITQSGDIAVRLPDAV
ncbi:putative clathrin assembly protein AP47 [Purpureocillium lilacinum]|uniref:Putative clathrin assembly protein AP47 n=1 Tax=Purpureocillium lilacinum TaxID=33203 RepID=A0A2U3E8G4_PURLI|nr:putative clathrin assembly protein AP47 [Purpureocillium lilacinum]